jgi:hypothetical protein
MHIFEEVLINRILELILIFPALGFTLIYVILPRCTHCCATIRARKSVDIGHSKRNFADMNKLIKLDMLGLIIIVKEFAVLSSFNV